MAKLFSALFVAMALLTAPASAAVQFFNQVADFNAATTGLPFNNDRFDNPIAAADFITFDSGITAQTIGGNRMGPDQNAVIGGRYSIAFDATGAQAAQQVQITFPIPVAAACFDFFGVPVGSMSVTVDGVTQTLVGSSTFGMDGFFGFFSTQPITSITFQTAASVFTDVFELDNIEFVDANAVPVPAALPLFGLGLAGAAALRRQRRRAAKAS